MDGSNFLSVLFKILIKENVWGNGPVIVVGTLVSIWFFYLYKKSRSDQLLNSLPGIWTSLGILGTFVVICVSLDDIKPETPIIDYTGSTVSEITSTSRIDIRDIISNLIPAFSTSIWGLIGAFIVTIISKIIFAIKDKVVEDKIGKESPEVYIKEIADGLAVVNSGITTQQKLLSDIISRQDNKYGSASIFYENIENVLSEIVSRQDTMAVIIQDFNSRLETNITSQSQILKKFVDDFVAKMDVIFRTMKESTEAQIEAFGKEQFSKTSEIMAVLSKQLNETAVSLIGNQQESVQQMMADTNVQLTTMAERITVLINQISNETSSAVQAMRDKQQQDLRDIVDTQTEMSSKLISQQSEFASVINERMQQEYAAMSQHNADSLGQMRDLQEAYAELCKKMLDENTAANREISDAMSAGFTQMSADLRENIESQVETLRSAIEHAVTTLKESYGFINGHIALIKSNYEQAVISFTDAVENAHTQNESINKAIETFNESMSSVKMTNDGISKVLDVLTSRQANIEKLISQVQELGGAIEALQSLENQLNRIAVRR